MPIVATICNYRAEPIVLQLCAVYRVLVKSCEFTLSPWANYVIYLMRRNLYGVITRGSRVINTSMNFWRELLTNLVYLAAVLAVVYILTYTDIVSHLLAS